MPNSACARRRRRNDDSDSLVENCSEDPDGVMSMCMWATLTYLLNCVALRLEFEVVFRRRSKVVDGRESDQR